MRRVGKGFSGVDTLLFEVMLVPQQVQDDIDAAVEDVDVVEPTPPLPTLLLHHHLNKNLSLHHHRRMHPNRGKITKLDADEDVTLEEVAAKVTKDADVQGRLEESQAHVYHLDLEHAQKVLSMQDDEARPAELKEVIKVVTTTKLMREVVTAAATTITADPMPKASAARRRKGVVIRDPEETATPSVIMHSEPKSKDKRKGILVKEPKPLKRQAHLEQDEAYARELEAELNANINWNKVIEQEIDEEACKVIKRKSESSEEKAAKKQRIDEEVEELKTYLQIIPNDEDDVYTEAIPQALKVYVIDYQIHTEHNKPYYKIIRADGTHQLFLSFISLLRNFDREDLEMLWKIIQERFASSEPKNSSDDFLLNALKTMFEKPNMILLVERRHPLTRFTLDQMLDNVRLEVKEESEESLELLRFVRRQHFGVDDVEDFKEYMLRLLEENAVADEKIKKLH
nr:hypothetical protein [Tanacetum cinerariifolium]